MAGSCFCTSLHIAAQGLLHRAAAIEWALPLFVPAAPYPATERDALPETELFDYQQPPLTELRCPSSPAHPLSIEHLQAGKCQGVCLLQVVIYAPSRTASQQGSSRTAGPLGKGPGWKIAFQNMQK